MAESSLNVKRATDPVGGTANAAEAPAKKLRSSDPDLKILVKDADEEGNVTAEKEYQVHSVLFAKHSKFIDTSLVVGMREKETKEVIFHGVSPDIFELAIKYLENPISVRYMDAEDALKVVEFYDKYEFNAGIELCGHILGEFAYKYCKKTNTTTPEAIVDKMVRVCVAADRFNLKACNKYCVKFLKSRLRSQDRCLFQLDHVKQLQPILIKHESTFLQDSLGLTREELESVLFPRVFVEAESNRCTESSIECITVDGTASLADGRYNRYGYCYYSKEHQTIWDGSMASFCICKSNRFGKDWVIMADFEDARESDTEEDEVDGEEGKVIWKCPFSSTLPIPPPGPWLPIHRTAKELPPPKIPTIRPYDS